MYMTKIKSLHAREVLDSRGHPTVEVELNGFRAICPAGTSRGKYEAIELHDGGSRYHGIGVSRAVENVNKIIAKRLIGISLDQQRVDEILCSLAGSNKWKIGGNATTAVSIAACKALGEKILGFKPSVPVPFSLIVEGGAHAGNDLSIQEFMLVPLNFTTFREAIRAVSEIYYTLENTVVKKYGKTASNVGYEGGFALPISDTKTVLNLISHAIEEAGYSKEVKIALDAAASQFFNSKYNIDGRSLNASQLADYYLDLTKIYPIISIEDPFNEEDFESFAMLKAKAKRFLVVGDDLTVTNISRIKKAIEKDSCNTLLVKVNQIGTVTEAIEAVTMARKSDWNIVVSHRSGDSEDTFIADFAVGLGALGAKFGAPMRGERTSKYNQLLRLEEQTILTYAGRNFKLP
ncbi:MAG TPA: phosphopyruvate hydratase [Candidatus Aenigmarchaeota archaeon]|nr:phosphopyruvate hydratase [Candidatus Aenigmarchaeota archaeon]